MEGYRTTEAPLAVRWRCSDHRAPITDHREPTKKIKSPEEIVEPIRLDQRLALDPRRPAIVTPLRVATRDLITRAPGLPPTGKTGLTPRDSILLLTGFPVRLDQRFAIDPRVTFCPYASRARAVIRLEPRTPHQPGKLQKLSKNECGSTLFQIVVNSFCAFVCACIFNRVQPVHKALPENRAASRIAPLRVRRRSCRAASYHRLRNRMNCGSRAVAMCKSRQKPRPEPRSAVPQNRALRREARPIGLADDIKTVAPGSYSALSNPQSSICKREFHIHWHELTTT